MKITARMVILAALCGTMLSGCTWLKEWPPSDQPEATPQAAMPPPPQTMAPQTMAPMAAQPVSYPVAPPPAQAYAGAGPSVTQVRFGQHDDKTRMVLDVSPGVNYSYDIDNNEKILLISLPGAGWAGVAQDAVAQSPYVASYQAVPDGSGGTQLVVQLRVAARVALA